MGSRWLLRRFRTGPQSEPRGHVSSTRSPVAGVALASEGIRSVPPVTPALHSGAEDSRAAERQRPSGRGPRARERRLQARLAQQPTPTGPTAAACARRAFRGTRVVARRNALSTSSSSTTPSGPARPFRLARVPRPGMTNTDVRLGTHPGDQTRQGPPYARSIASRTLSRTNAHAYTDTDDNRAVGLSPRLRLDRSADRFPLAPLRNGVAWSCGVDERGAAGTLPGAAQGRRIPGSGTVGQRTADRGHSSGTTPCRRSWSCRNSTGSGGTRCRNRLPGPRPRSCSSRSAIWTCRYWRLSSCPEASGVTASAPANRLPTEDAVK